MNKLIYKLAQYLRSVGFNFHEENDPRVKAMREKIAMLGGVQFNLEFFPDGTWAAESINVDGIITGGSHRKNVNAILKDAVFTYFEIPPLLCNDSLIRAPEEPLRLEQRVYA